MQAQSLHDKYRGIFGGLAGILDGFADDDHGGALQSKVNHAGPLARTMPGREIGMPSLGPGHGATYSASRAATPAAAGTPGAALVETAGVSGAGAAFTT